MRYANQAAILKALGFQFIGLRSDRGRRPFYARPIDGVYFGIPLFKTSSKADLMSLVAEYHDAVNRCSARDRDYQAGKRRKSLKAIDGDRPWFKPVRPTGQLKLVA